MKFSPKPRLKLNNWLLPVLVGSLLVMQITYPYKGWQILLVGLGGVWLVGYLWVRNLARSLSLTREIRYGWAHVGDRLEERFTLTNSSFIPAPWVEIIDQTTMPDYTAGRVTGVDGTSQNRWHTRGRCTRRGIFTLGPTTVHTGDPFGLYTLSLHYPDSTTVTVTPPVVPLPSIQVAPGGRAGEGRPRPNAFERTVSTAGVRHYIPGDSLHRIHWPTTARQGSPFVHLFDSMPSGDWWLFLDLDRQVQAGQGATSTEEHGVILVASLADRGLRSGRAVGLIAHGQELVWLPPQSGDLQRREIMRALALIKPGPRPLAELMARTRPAIDQGTSLIVITAAVDGTWIEALFPLLQRGAVATVLLLDPGSFSKGTTASVEAAPAANSPLFSGNVDGTKANSSLIIPTTTVDPASLAGGNNSGAAQSLLTNLGLTHYLITSDLLDRPEARPGRQGRWEWHISPSGRAMPLRQQRDMSWRALE
jgi:uncharacterized protein (DUF58 family)